MSYLVFRLSGHPKDSNGATVGMNHSSKQSVSGVQCVVLLYRCTQHLRNRSLEEDSWCQAIKYFLFPVCTFLCVSQREVCLCLCVEEMKQNWTFTELWGYLALAERPLCGFVGNYLDLLNKPPVWWISLWCWPHLTRLIPKCSQTLKYPNQVSINHYFFSFREKCFMGGLNCDR